MLFTVTHLAEDRRRDGGPDEGFGVTVVVRNVLVKSHKSPEFLASWLDLIERWFADIARERIGAHLEPWRPEQTPDGRPGN